MPDFFEKKTPLGIIQKLAIDSVTVINKTDADTTSADEIQNDNDISYTQKLQRLADKQIVLQQHSMTTEEFHQLVDLIFKNIDLFATSMHDLVGSDVELMHIDTGDAGPVRKRPYRQSAELQKATDSLINEMLEANIQPSNSPWSSPCLLIKKSRTNKYRFVNDFRALNKITKPIFWPLPTLEDVFDSVSNRNTTIFYEFRFKRRVFSTRK